MHISSSEELISKMTLVGVAITDILVVVFTSGAFTLWSALGGAVLLLLLLSYSKHGDPTQTPIEHVLSSATFALSSLLLLGWLVEPLYQFLGLGRYVLFLPMLGSLSVTWAVFAFGFWLIAVFVWMRVFPKQRWAKLFQTMAHS